MKMAEGCCGASILVLFCLLITQRCVGFSVVFAIPDKRDDDALRREYPLEEFLWTGSGDGPEDQPGETPVSWVTTTVYRTTTRLLALPASVSLFSQASVSCPKPASCTPVQPSQTWTDELPTSPVFTLEPSEQSLLPSTSSKYFSATPTLSTASVMHTSSPVPPSDRPPDKQADGATVPDQSFWIVTVVEEEDQRRAPDTPVMEVGLARLYATAFKRQQERHLGIINATNAAMKNRISGIVSRRRRVAQHVDPLTNVLVRVHNVTGGEPRRVQLVYSVHVRGKPILARTAVHDMRLVSDAEVAQELGGLSVVTKAEPYLKERETALWRPFSTSPWLLAAGAISVVALLALVLILLLLATTRHKRARRIAGNQQERRGTVNASFEPDVVRPAGTLSDQGSVSPASDTKILPSEEGDWGIDSEFEELPPPSADQAAAAISAAVAAARDGISSPTSYLSMPSVRKFPRGGNIPEPLSQILQQGTATDVRGCLSMRNLDLYPDESAFEPRHSGVSTPPPPRPRSPWGARHGSLDGEDPGVVGPCVYQMAQGAGPARRRFQELLDDAFSLFGGRSDEEEQRTPTPPPRPPSPRILDSRVHSAAQARVSEPESPPLRPKTSEPRRTAMQCPRRGRLPVAETPRVSSAGPRGAWETPGERVTSVRPLSAGPFHRPRLPEACKPPPHRGASPRVSTERILADAELPATDPAVPLISAIKDELQRLQGCTSCATTPLPGSCHAKQ